MFDGRTFLNVGNHLHENSGSDSSSEAMLRSSVGRYYYACFHVARKAFKAEQNWNDREKSSHSKIIKSVRKNCGSTVSSMLDTLRIMREHADYHCWLPKTKQMGEVEFTTCPCDWNPDLEMNSREACRIAAEILQELGKHAYGEHKAVLYQTERDYREHDERSP